MVFRKSISAPKLGGSVVGESAQVSYLQVPSLFHCEPIMSENVLVSKAFWKAGVCPAHQQTLIRNLEPEGLSYY